MRKLRMIVGGSWMAVVVVVVVACGGGAATERRETLDSIPEAAAAALRRTAGGARIERVEREGDVYEATWHVDGLEREAAVTARGVIVELEEEVPSTQVPAAVRAAAIIKLPNASSLRFVRLMSGNFEAEAIVDGREQDVTLSPDGREVPGDDGEDDD